MGLSHHQLSPADSNTSIDVLPVGVSTEQHRSMTERVWRKRQKSTNRRSNRQHKHALTSHLAQGSTHSTQLRAHGRELDKHRMERTCVTVLRTPLNTLSTRLFSANTQHSASHACKDSAQHMQLARVERKYLGVRECDHIAQQTGHAQTHAAGTHTHHSTQHTKWAFTVTTCTYGADVSVCVNAPVYPR